VGSAEGERGNALLFRALSARLLSGGELLVSNSGSQELLVFDSSGLETRSFGSLGEGPGEFGRQSSMMILSVFGDSVAVADRRRIQVFGLNGNWGRTILLTATNGFGIPNPVASFSNGNWLGYLPVGSGNVGWGEIGEPIEMSFGLVRYSRDGASAEPFTTVKGRPRAIADTGLGGRGFPYVPLTAAPSYAVHGTSILLNVSGNPELLRIQGDGAVEAIYRWDIPRTSVEDIWSRFSSAFVEGLDESERVRAENLLAMRDLPIPTLVPAVASILVDSEGYIWAERYRLPWERTRIWDVLDATGKWLGKLKTPDGLGIQEIGSDFILGIHRDDLGVERAVVYDLFRNRVLSVD